MLNKYTVVDIETTGLDYKDHKITEIAAVNILNNKIIGRFQELINPECIIPPEITQLTGITDFLVKDKRIIRDVLPEFVQFVGQNPIVAHNIAFDYNFINYNTQKYLDLSLNNKKICTVKLARKLFKNIASCRLESLCNYFNIENTNAHRAMSDVLATTKLFLKFQAILHNNGIQEENQLFDFFENPISRLNLPVSSFI